MALKQVENLTRFGKDQNVDGFAMNEMDVYQELVKSGMAEYYEQITTDNISLFDDTASLKQAKFTDDELAKFLKARTAFYYAKRCFLIKKFEMQLMVLENKIRFIKLEDLSDLRGKDQAEMSEFLEDKNFDANPLKQLDDKVVGDYEYLLSMPFSSFSTEKVDSFLAEKNAVAASLSKVQSLDPLELWKEDIVSISEKLKPLSQVMDIGVTEEKDDLAVEPLEKEKKAEAPTGKGRGKRGKRIVSKDQNKIPVAVKSTSHKELESKEDGGDSDNFADEDVDKLADIGKSKVLAKSTTRGKRGASKELRKKATSVKPVSDEEEEIVNEKFPKKDDSEECSTKDFQVQIDEDVKFEASDAEEEDEDMEKVLVSKEKSTKGKAKRGKRAAVKKTNKANVAAESGSDVESHQVEEDEKYEIEDPVEEAILQKQEKSGKFFRKDATASGTGRRLSIDHVRRGQDDVDEDDQGGSDEYAYVPVEDDKGKKGRKGKVTKKADKRKLKDGADGDADVKKKGKKASSSDSKLVSASATNARIPRRGAASKVNYNEASCEDEETITKVFEL